MIVDFNAFVGSFWPGRELADGSPSAVKKILKKAGVEAAWVALMEGPWYRDQQAGNEKLAGLVERHRDFFLPLACIDPTTSYWEKDVERCLGTLGMAGVRLYPAYHHYQLDDQRVAALCGYLGARKAPVFITMMIEEDRFSHPAVKVMTPDPKLLGVLLDRAGETTFVVNMLDTRPARAILMDARLRGDRVFFDTTRMDKDTLNLDALVEETGHDRLVLGTNAPFFYPEGALLNLAFRTFGDGPFGPILQSNYERNPVLAKAVKKLTAGRKRVPAGRIAEIVSCKKTIGRFHGRLIDQHAHFTDEEPVMEGMIAQARRAGVGRILLNGLGKIKQSSFGGWSVDATPECARAMNESAIRWCAKHPDLLRFIAYINPRNGKSAVDEVARYVKEHGAIGLKIHGCVENGSIEKTFPVVEKAASLDIPILFHTFFRKGGNNPEELTPLHVIELAKAYPKAKLILAHFGGDWVRTARSIAPYPNIYGDTSGCTHRAGFTEFAVRTIGAERIMFGVDMWCRSFGTQIAKIVAANITAAEKECILYRNQERLFRL